MKRILMLLENNYLNDSRVKNEAQTLVSAGYKVTVISLGEGNQYSKECINGVTVYKVPTINLFSKSHKYDARPSQVLIANIKSKIGFIFEYIYFTSICVWMSFIVMFKEGFDVIHAHNPPDTLLIVGAIHKIFGKKYVFDHHDLSPELYLSRFGEENGIVAKGLRFLEYLNLKLANIVIATNESYKAIEVARGKINPNIVHIVRNGPNLNRIREVEPDQELKKMRKHILVYVGCMGPQDGVDYLLRSIHHLVYEIGRKDFFCLIIGKGDSFEDLKALSHQLEIGEYIRFTGYVSDDDLIRYLSTADIGLDPNPSNPLNDLSTWIKVMEYMAMGKPIVSFDLKETRFTAGDAAIYVRPNDIVEFAEAIAYLLDDPERRKAMGLTGKSKVDTELNWSVVSRNLLSAYDKLF